MPFRPDVRGVVEIIGYRGPAVGSSTPRLELGFALGELGVVI